MHIPHAPDSDTESDRHRFYGSLSTSLDNVNDHLNRNIRNIDEIKQTIDGKYSRIKTLIENLHMRVNKCVDITNFDNLADNVDSLSKHEIANRTMWATGKTFIVGAWVVFTLLFGWGYSLTQAKSLQLETTIHNNEKTIRTLQNKITLSEKEISTFKVINLENKEMIKLINQEDRQINTSVKSLFQNINSLSDRLNRHEKRSQEYEDTIKRHERLAKEFEIQNLTNKNKKKR